MRVLPIFTDLSAALEEAEWLANKTKSCHGIYALRKGFVVRKIEGEAGNAVEIVHPVKEDEKK